MPADLAERLRAGSRKGGTNSSGRASTEEAEAERRAKISKKMSEVGGGYRPGSGVGKKGWYKGIWCDSSWELAWVIYMLDHKVSFARNWARFPYVWNGKTSHYVPDFLLADGTYIEIKGVMTDRAKAKLEAFNSPLMVIGITEIKQYLDYVIANYGKDFIRLYD
jgi:hypothetical protein